MSRAVRCEKPIAAETSSRVAAQDRAPGRLRPGPGLPPGTAAASHKGRLYRALFELLSGRDVDVLTVRGLCRSAGVSAEAFYRYFDNVEDCLAGAYAASTGRTLRRAREAWDSAGGRDAGVRAALRTVISDAAADPDAAHAALLGVYTAGPGMLLRVHRAGRGFERLAAEVLDVGDGVAPEILTAIVAGLARVIRVRVLEGRLDELGACVDPLADWALSIADPLTRGLPALGDAVLDRSRPLRPTGPPRPPSPLEGDEVGARILAAVARLAAGHHYWQLTAAVVRAEARVSRKEFAERFDGLADSWAAAAGRLLLGVADDAGRGAEGASNWKEGLCRVTLRILREISHRPEIGRLAFGELFEAGLPGVRCQAAITSHAARRLRGAAPDAQEPGEVAAEATVAAAWMLVNRRVVAGEERLLQGLSPTLAYLALAPYEGADAAIRAVRAGHEALVGPLPPPAARR